MKSTLKERLASKTKINHVTGCHEWTGYVQPNGYAKIRDNGKRWNVHQAAWIIHHGPIPISESKHDYCVCHHCDNRRCVNPDHLFMGSQFDNMHDMIDKGRKNAVTGNKHGMSKLTQEKVNKLRSMYKSMSIKQKDLALMFDVSKQQISAILNNKFWSETK